MEHWLPLFYERLETLFDYLPRRRPDRRSTIWPREARDERLAMIADAFEAREQRRAQDPLPRPGRRTASISTADGVGRSGWPSARAAGSRPFQREAADGVVDMGAKLGRNFAAERAQDSVNLFEATADHARRWPAAGKRVLFASWSEGSSDRLGAMLADHGLKDVAFAPYWQAAKAADPKKPQRAVLPLETGFETDNLAVISETDILGDRLARPRRKRRRAPTSWPRPRR